MDIAFFDPDISHADHLSAALLAHLRAEQLARPVRAAKYGPDAGRWQRGKTPDDLRDAFDERVQAALRELREATAESEDDDDDGDEGRMTTQAWPGVGGRATLATPPTSGDEEEELGAVGKRKRGEGDGWPACKRVRVRTG
ncbi:hypothetical protein UCRNP2_6941 [Neofusicoccum parvum UCRNP2]|uniref:Uncharacterized protein n=2 Tax=Neofusicoccum parvum TaxID=310453 RepID=R1EFM3_BOTPV|nr:hypothetical protein UCRNP2_6941 [Neofusicoccum parvum UCRNP2]GME35272.1 hypothetical protein GTA08_BOTSDO12333 [Neofusicoccum parvum]